jgi:hypothetical protein
MLTAILPAVILAVFILWLVYKAISRCFVQHVYMPELSDPVINHAQEVANRTRKVQLIVPNSFGGYDIVPADRVTLESNVNFAGTVRPQAFKGAMKCLN